MSVDRFDVKNVACHVDVVFGTQSLDPLGGFAMPTAKICQCGDFTPFLRCMSGVFGFWPCRALMA